MKKLPTTVCALFLTLTPGLAQAAVSFDDVLKTYGDIAHAGYEDSLTSARDLLASVNALSKSPSAESLAAARAAWILSRAPYQQTEVFRFGNPIVDDWEGRVNAWPLDEGLIDYVDTNRYGEESDNNTLYRANVIANRELTANGQAIDASQISKTLLSEHLQEAGGIEANVATGYHAIEFLLWGQDLNGTGPGAGNRPHTDFDVAHCTGGNCDRRVAYLTVASELLVDDLKEMVANWVPDGAARAALVRNPAQGIQAIITGMGSLSYGELAGQRIKLGLMLHDPEEEHDCFSDNTHYSHFYDAKGVQNVYLGRYVRTDGRVVQGPSLSDLIKEKTADVDQAMATALDHTMQTMTVLVQTAEGGEAYDQMIGNGNVSGNAIVQATVDALTEQTRTLEKVVAALRLNAVAFEGSDSLDNPQAVGQ